MTTALLVIDVQRALTDLLEPQRRSGFLGTLASLIARARNANVPVIYIQHSDETELIEGTPGWQIAGEIGPAEGDSIVGKRFRDSFRETELARVLESLDSNHLVACGMQTEYCVDATVREAERRGYRVTLVADGTATYPADGVSEQQIQAQIHRVAYGVAEITASKDLFS